MHREVGNQISRDALEEALSLERFGRYLAWAQGDRDRAIELYALNTAISESLYTPLQMLEVALRNRIHAVLSEARPDDCWLHDDSVLLTERQRDQVAKATEDVRADGKEATPGRVVAALTFSFWTTMLGKEYEEMWRSDLHRIGRRPDGAGLLRKHFSGPLTPIRTLRNRIAHHEPILMWDLPKHYAKTLELTSWLSPAAADWCRACCRFDHVHPPGRIDLHQE